MTEAVQTAHAKINFFLEIAGRRDDGYRDIVTLFHEIELSDRVALRLSAGGEDVISISGLSAGVASGRDNLCLKALDALRRRAGALPFFEIELTKRIPTGAGLGGGSSDAAAAIKAANELLSLGLSDGDMRRIAAEVGSDAPFFITGGSAVGRGRGDELEHIEPFAGGLNVVVAAPARPMPTADAYALAAEYTGARRLETADARRLLAAGSLERLKEMMFNAFEQFVITARPEIAALKRGLLEAGCAAALLSGSGSAVFGLCESPEAARLAARAMAAHPEIAFIHA